MKKEKIWIRIISILLILNLVLTPLGSIKVRAEEPDDEQTSYTADDEDEEEEEDDGEDEEDDEDEQDDENPQKTQEESKPTEPEPTEPKPTEPKPTEPKPTEPQETEPKHEHDYSFEVNEDGDSLRAYCDEDNCPNEKITVKLITANKVYDGKAATVSLDGADTLKKEIGATTSLSVSRGGAPAADLVAAGSYTAEAVITIGSSKYTLKQQFEIGRRTVIFSGVTAKSKVYDGTTDVELNTSKLTFSGNVNGDAIDVSLKTKGFPKADVGVYSIPLEDIKLTGADINNYTLDLNKSQSQCEFVEISRRDISNAQVVMGPTLFFNGRQQTQKVESVRLLENGEELPLEITYSVRNNTAQNEGSYTLTISGTGNFSGSISKDYLILPSADQVMGNSMQYGKGFLSVGMQANDLGISLISGLETAISQLPADRLVAVAEGDSITWTLIPQQVPLDSTMQMVIKTAVGERKLMGDGIYFALYETVNGVTSAVEDVRFTPSVSMKMTSQVGKKDIPFLRLVRSVPSGSGGLQSVEPVEMTYNSKDQTYTFAAKMNSVYTLWGREVSTGSKVLMVVMTALLLLSGAGLGIAAYLLYKVRSFDDAENPDDFNIFRYLKNRIGREREKAGDWDISPSDLVAKRPPAAAKPEPAQPTEPADEPEMEAEPEFTLEEILSEVEAYEEEAPEQYGGNSIVSNQDEERFRLYELEKILGTDNESE